MRSRFDLSPMLLVALAALGLLPMLGVSGGSRAADPSDAASPIVFTDVTRQAGLLEPLAGIMGHGGAWGDFDNDGHLDLFVGGFCDRPNSEYAPATGPVHTQLLRNLGGGRFAPANQKPVEMFGRTSGALFADLDNSGRLALYVSNNARPNAKPGAEPQASSHLVQCKLFRNDAGVFIDISDESNACPKTLISARNIVPLDYDNDGLLDLLVIEDKFTAHPRTVLLHNKGNMKFEDANKAAGLPENIFGLGVAVADLNGDGRPDFFVGHSNRLFLSRPDGTYYEPEELKKLFAWKPLDNEDWPCGVAFGDLNHDGLLDMVLSIHHTGQARNRVYLNTGLKDGVPQFRDVTDEVGLGDAVPVRCPHVEIQDFDNDGEMDIYVSAAWLDDGDKVTPLIYRNVGVKDGLPHFIAPRPVKMPMVYYPAGPTGDYDNDGRLDIFLVNWFAGNHSRLLHNDSPAGNQWLTVKAVGKKSNRMGIGTKVWLYPAGKSGAAKSLLGYQEISTGFGYASGQPALAHFGLGKQTGVDVVAKFPSGRTATINATPAGKLLVIEEPEN